MDFKKFYEEYKDGDVEVAPGVSYCYYDVLTESRRLFHSQFETPKTSTGLEKIFFNIGYTFYDTVYRHTDIDSKDMQLKALNRNGRYSAPIIRGALEAYMNRENFDTFINITRGSLLQDGVVYIKLVGTTPYVVDPFNIIESPNQEGLGTMAERIFMSPEDVMEEYGSHDGVKEIVDTAKEEGRDIAIYEYWEDGKSPTCEVWISKELPDPKNYKTDWSPEVKVTKFKTPKKDQFGNPTLPYSKTHSVFVRGRRGGFGIPELVKGILMNYNELMNINREKNILDMRGIFTFKKGFSSRSIPQSFLNKIGLGGFLELESGEEIQRMPYQYIANEVMSTADNLFNTGRQLTGATAMDTGEKLPSRVSATAVADSRQNAQTTYDVVIENMSILFSDFMERLYAPAVLDALTKEEAIAITGDIEEMEQLDRVLVEAQVYTEMYEMKESHGFYGTMKDGQAVPIVTDEGIEAEIEQRLATDEGDTRWIKITEELKKSLEYSIRFYVGNEKFDKAAKLQNLMAWRQSVTNPFVGERIDMRIADLLGDDPKLFRTPKSIKIAYLREQANAVDPQPEPQQQIPVDKAPTQQVGQPVAPDASTLPV